MPHLLHLLIISCIIESPISSLFQINKIPGIGFRLKRTASDFILSLHFLTLLNPSFFLHLPDLVALSDIIAITPFLCPTFFAGPTWLPRLLLNLFKLLFWRLNRQVFELLVSQNLLDDWKTILNKMLTNLFKYLVIQGLQFIKILWRLNKLLVESLIIIDVYTWSKDVIQIRNSGIIHVRNCRFRIQAFIFFLIITFSLLL